MKAQSNIEGKICSSCGEYKAAVCFSKRSKSKDGLQARCKLCNKISRKPLSPEKRAERLEYERAWRKKNKQAKEQYEREWRARNKERIQETSRQYYIANRERIKKANSEYVKANPDKNIAKEHRRRARQRSSNGNYTAEEFNELCAFYNHTCLCCGATDVLLTVDHVIPLCKEGSNDISNIQPLCKSCNSSKGSKSVDYRTRSDA